MRDTQAILKTADHIVVLDLETGNDPAGLAVLGKPSARGERSALQRVRSAAMLVVPADGSSLALHSFHEGGEDEILEALADHLDPAAAADATLVTYDGRRHDLPVLRRRAARHMLFDRPGLTHWGAGAGRHVDLARDIHPPNGAASPLAEVCAGLDIALPDIGAAQGGSPLHVRKGQLDCLATYLVLLHEQALARGDGRHLLQGWRLAARLIETRRDLKHLRGMDRPARRAAPL